MIVRKLYQQDGRTIEFVPIRGAPGFTHRVILNGEPVDWLAHTHKPSVKTAAYYFDKHNQ